MTSRLALRIPQATKRALEAHAASRGLTVSALVVELVAGAGEAPRASASKLQAAQNASRRALQVGIARPKH